MILSHATKRALAFGKSTGWVGLSHLVKQESGARCNARRTISTASVSSSQMHTTASSESPIPLSAEEEEGSLGGYKFDAFWRSWAMCAFRCLQTGRNTTERLLARLQGVLGKTSMALAARPFERTVQAKMVTLEDYRQYLSSLSGGRLLGEDMRERFARDGGPWDTWRPELPFWPWSPLFERLFPQSLGYDVRVENVVGKTYDPGLGCTVEIDAAYLYVRRAALDGDGPVLLLVGGWSARPEDRLQESMATITQQVAEEAAELMRDGKTRERILWLGFCGEHFCWGHMQWVGVPPILRPPTSTSSKRRASALSSNWQRTSIPC